MFCSITTAEANGGYRDQLLWANMLRKDFCRKGRDLPGIVFPVFLRRGQSGMTKSEVLYELEKLGAKVSYPTLNRYVSDGLVKRPVTESRGRKEGRVSHYSQEALYEAYTVWKLLNGPVRINKDELRWMVNNPDGADWIWRDTIFSAYFFHQLGQEVQAHGSMNYFSSNPDAELLQKKIKEELEHFDFVLEYYLVCDGQDYSLWKRNEKSYIEIQRAGWSDIYGRSQLQW